MSSFNGRIKEYPTIAIDRYQASRQGVRAFFLSHCHADHLSGLDSPNFDLPLYCSQVTANLLPRLASSPRSPSEKGNKALCFKYSRLRKYLKPLPMEESTQIYIGNGQTISVTLFPANHCPGSTMFLIEGANANILYTGDIRAESWFLFGIEEYVQKGIIPKLDTVYLDTTFCHEDYVEFPTKNESIETIISIMKQHPAYHFRLGYNILGIEPLWEQIADIFNTQIYLSPSRYGVYTSLTPPLPYITTVANSTRFHACDRCDRCRELQDKGLLICIRPSTMWWRGELRNAAKGMGNLGKAAVKTGSHSWHVLYALHSSLLELQSLISILRPRQVIPCVVNRENAVCKNAKELFKPFLDTTPIAVSNVETLKEDTESSQATEIIEEEADCGKFVCQMETVSSFSETKAERQEGSFQGTLEPDVQQEKNSPSITIGSSFNLEMIENEESLVYDENTPPTVPPAAQKPFTDNSGQTGSDSETTDGEGGTAAEPRTQLLTVKQIGTEMDGDSDTTDEGASSQNSAPTASEDVREQREKSPEETVAMICFPQRTRELGNVRPSRTLNTRNNDRTGWVPNRSKRKLSMHRSVSWNEGVAPLSKKVRLEKSHSFPVLGADVGKAVSEVIDLTMDD